MKKKTITVALMLAMIITFNPVFSQSALAADTTPPTLTDGLGSRMPRAFPAISFTSDEAGIFYWQIDGTIPIAEELISNVMSPRHTLVIGTNTRNFAGLSTDSHTIYIVAEDAAGNISNMLAIDIPAYSSGSTGDGNTTYHTVSFNTNGGNAANSKSVAHNDKVTKPDDPTKEGFVFGGWYSDSTLKTPYDFSKAIASNITLYAKWALPFTDVAEDAWFYDAIYYVYECGLMIGTSDDNFSPDNSLTRAMIVTILYRNAKAPDVGNLDNRFDDVANGQWYTDAVKWASENDIVQGYGDGKFGTNDPVTKEQLAALIYRLQQSSGKVSPDIHMDAEWPDGDKVSDWAKSAVDALTLQGLFMDIPGRDFNPHTPATRAEVASILYRYLTSVE